MSEEPKTGESAPPKATASGAVSPTADATQLGEGMKEVRSLLQRTGALLGAAATAVLAGLGYARLHEIFPVPANAGHSWRLAIAFFVAAVLGSAWLAGRFLAAQRRILLNSDPDSWDKFRLKGDDKTTAEDILEEHAREEEAP